MYVPPLTRSSYIDRRTFAIRGRGDLIASSAERALTPTLLFFRGGILPYFVYNPSLITNFLNLGRTDKKVLDIAMRVGYNTSRRPVQNDGDKTV